MTQKVQVILFSQAELEPKVLLFRRVSDGKWHPITGGVEDGEAIDVAAFREVMEESGLTEPARIISDIHTFTFMNPPEHHRAGPVTEYVFAFEVLPDFKPVISSEHSEARWFTVPEALGVLTTDDQRLALSKLVEILSK